MCLKRAVLFLHLTALTASHSSPCLLRCKDNNMNEVEKVVGRTNDWTADLVAPMHSILRGLPETANSHPALINRLRSICKANIEFANCVRSCNQRTAGIILLKGQTSWTNICAAFRHNIGEFTSAIVPCWARHGAEVGRRCALYATIVHNAVLDLVDNGIHAIQQHVSDLCKSITMYDKCYVWQADAFCGERAWRFLLQLNQNSSV
ncbi:unnamed protein product [Toxocara canis]|nr:unnamed protein product [Toxocara canis]